MFGFFIACLSILCIKLEVLYDLHRYLLAFDGLTLPTGYTMNAMICVCLFALFAAVMSAPNEKYTSKYNNVNLDEILSSDRLLKGYIECCLDEGPCTPEGKELRSHLEEALEDDCEHCTEEHREGAKKVIKYLVNNKPAEWKRICDKFDPEGKFAKKYEKEYKEVQG